MHTSTTYMFSLNLTVSLTPLWDGIYSGLCILQIPNRPVLAIPWIVIIFSIWKPSMPFLLGENILMILKERVEHVSYNCR